MQVKAENDTLLKKLSDIEKQSEQFKKEQIKTANYYRMLIESADDGISFYDNEGQLKFSNPAFYSLLGLTKDSYNIETSVELIHPDDRDFHVRREAELKERGFFESELRLLHKDGHYVFLSTRSVSVRDESGEVTGSLIISRDITKLKKEHEELIKANMVAEASK